MRPLPLSVWKERRAEINASEFSGLSIHSAKQRAMFASSSFASSIKTSTRLRWSGRLCDRQSSEQLEATLGIFEHVPWIGAAEAHCLHVVLDADDRIGKPLEMIGT